MIKKVSILFIESYIKIGDLYVIQGGDFKLSSSYIHDTFYFTFQITYSKCNISLNSYKNKVITSVEFDTMKKTYVELSEISFTEVQVRCAMVMALVHNNGEVDNRTSPTPSGST